MLALSGADWVLNGLLYKSVDSMAKIMTSKSEQERKMQHERGTTCCERSFQGDENDNIYIFKLYINY
ncbi:hypothetical protein CTM84_17220 [Photobacterium kishitanii]|nr:hypothetical protein CTM84_17220 [Photobacterium kishitanii]